MNKINNSEILLIYEAKYTNPNGDPDNENKPRMDYATSRNIVSDVRLKRFIRDFFYKHLGMDIFVRKEDDGSTVDATTRANNIAQKKGKKGADLELLKEFIDIRFFGVTLPLKKQGKKQVKEQVEKQVKEQGSKGSSITLTGPLQFTWGYSLNEVEILNSPSITSHFAGAKETGGSIGKFWIVKYSLISFYGRINGKLAEYTGLTYDDIKKLDENIFEAILCETSTRSKIGHHPLLYMRIEYNDNLVLLGDLRRFVDIDKKKGIENTRDFELDISRLIDRILNIQHKISKLVVRLDTNMSYLENEIKNKLSQVYVNFI
ncbi:MAG: type I-B CRISPR-associated protein Cas7/Csh2 [candidate division WOR-3 bacterium]|nr:type I-B CRISPR-associated protein Cas7/Csh2 [candidate division WOR-3 bacterium]MDW8151290.1 type I-B CRISPR-associated protein Cas7/Csh2 [candidate division WOR-3 bacterium]